MAKLYESLEEAKKGGGGYIERELKYLRTLCRKADSQ